jgi:hypothetical protein
MPNTRNETVKGESRQRDEVGARRPSAEEDQCLTYMGGVVGLDGVELESEISSGWQPRAASSIDEATALF